MIEISLFCVLDVQVVIENFESDSVIQLDAKAWPESQGDSSIYKVTFFLDFFSFMSIVPLVIIDFISHSELLTIVDFCSCYLMG